jgi:hypothetical protein
MKNVLVIAALLGLAFVAILNHSWPWLAAVVGVATSSVGAGGMYKQALVVSLGTVVFVFGAMIIETLLNKLFAGSKS